MFAWSPKGGGGLALLRRPFCTASYSGAFHLIMFVAISTQHFANAALLQLELQQK